MPDHPTHMQPTTAAGPQFWADRATQHTLPDQGVVQRDGRDPWMIVLQGVVDAEAVTRLQRQVNDALTGYDCVVIDLRDVSLLGTPTLAMLCCALRRLHRPGVTFVVSGAAPPAQHALKLCQLPGVELARGPDATSRCPPLQAQ